MKLFKLAKELGVSSTQVMSAMRTMGIIPPENHFCAISDEQVESMRRHFVRLALGGERIGGEGIGSESVAGNPGSTPSSEPNASSDSPNAFSKDELKTTKPIQTAPIVVRRAAGNIRRLSTSDVRQSKIPSELLGRSLKQKDSH